MTMRALTAAERIAIWEQHGGPSSLTMVTDMLAVVSEEEERAALPGLSLGERDRRLLLLREMTYGSRVYAMAVCSECNERLDLEFSTADVLQPFGAPPMTQDSIVSDGYTVTFRAPCVADLADLETATNPVDAKRTLLLRCVLDAQREGRQISPTALPEALLARVIEAIPELDPLIEIRLDARCPACGHASLVDFDIASFFLKELETDAKGILGDVHVLAGAYGWGEQEILQLTEARRGYYLNRIING